MNLLIKKYHVRIVPYHWDKSEEVFDIMLQHYNNSKFIDVHDDTKKVLKEISECEYVISTSLHGLIVADSYGIPNCWCEISDRVQCNGFKFHDYFSSFGMGRECFDLRDGNLPILKRTLNAISNQLINFMKKNELIECFHLEYDLFNCQIFSMLTYGTKSIKVINCFNQLN